jgi:hypothetical protein
MAMTIQRRVVCAALRNSSGDIITGARHYDSIMRASIERERKDIPHVSGGTTAAWRAAEQGFIDQWCVFMSRNEALQVALAADQRIRRCGGDEHQLYSENLY